MAGALVFAVSLLTVMVGGKAAGPAAPCDPAGGLNGFPFCDVSLSIDARAADLVGRLNLTEKVQQLVNQAAAVPRLGIPAYQWWSEALHGVSNVGPGSKFGGAVPGATQFPQVIHSAASFNTSLWFLLGQAVSTEARGMFNIGFAGLTFWSPNVNIFRDPRWGRGQETPGEDPTLTSKYAVNYVRGLQTAPDGADRLKVAACCKHYTAYDLDNWNGIQRYTFDARVTPQDLADTFDPPFQSCVEDAGVASVMCSYNKVNGVPTCADPNILAGTVRAKWSLNGYIVSDCDSVDVFFRSQRYTSTAEAAAAAALNAGLDLNCGSFLAQHTEAAVQMGLVNESRVDNAVLNNFRVLMRLGWFDGNKKLFGNLGAADVCTEEHRQLALEAARQGIVLLKNDGTLPLSAAKIATLAVVGPNANVTDTMIGNYAGVACRYTTPLQGLSSYTKTVYAPGCANVLCADGGLVSGAATAAAGADAVVLLVGGDQSLEAESRDRTSLRLPGKQEDLVNAVIQAAKGPVILFIMSGGPFDIDFAKNNDKVAGILWAGYPGQEGGQAIGDAIFGAYSPSGRLPVSWYPEEYTKIPMTNMNMRPDPSTGYPGRTHRFYTGRTLYQFGDGLSYTTFNHTLVRAPSVVPVALLGGRSRRHGQGGACAGTGNGTCRAVRVTHTRCSGLSMDVQVDVRNLGKRDSGHVLLLFSSPPGRGGAPQRHLIGFRRLHVSAGATQRVHFAVDVCRDLSVVDKRGSRRVPVGSHLLHIGGVKHSFNMHIRD